MDFNMLYIYCFYLLGKDNHLKTMRNSPVYKKVVLVSTQTIIVYQDICPQKCLMLINLATFYSNTNFRANGMKALH